MKQLSWLWVFAVLSAGAWAQCTEEFEGTLVVDGGIWTVDVGWSLVDGSGAAVQTGAVGTFSLCLPADCYTLELTDSAGDGWTGTYYDLYAADGTLLYHGSLNDATEGDGSSWGTDYTPLGDVACGVGCLDPVACNFDATATLEGGICDYTCLGCTDATACNYDPLVTVDDGSCTVFDDCGECGGSNESCGGCMDPTNCNYDPTATVDDGSCITNGQGLTLSIHTDDFPFETQWQVENIYTGTVIYDGNYPVADSTYVHDICLSPGCYEIKFFDWSGDGMCCAYGQGWFTFVHDDGTVIAEGGDYGYQLDIPFCVGSDYGCTDTAACNYDSTALTDDASCNYGCYGCTDPTACNYELSATLDDGLCEYPQLSGYCACDEFYHFEATLDGGQSTTAVNQYGAGQLDSLKLHITSWDGVSNDATSVNDMVIRVDAPDGSCFAFGGFFYDPPVECQYLGDYTFYPGFLYEPDGSALLEFDVSEGGLSGEGGWQVKITNGYWTSDGLTTVSDIELVGLCNNIPEPNTCPEDLNQDGVVTVADVLLLLGSFGCTSGCNVDVNGDDALNVADLLMVLSAFSSEC